MTQEQENKLSVVIPAYNEETTIYDVVKKVSKISYLLEIIIVDDASTDNTSLISTELSKKDSRIKYIRLPQNSGKTEALKAGFAISRGEIVIVQDADLEYDPAEIFNVIEPILEGKADVVYGSRFMVKKATRVLYFYHYLANKFLTFLSNCLTNLNMTDVETCYKAFNGEIIRNMVIKSTGFGFEIEVTAKIAKLKCRVFEVPISYYGRTYEEGKKIGLKDGIAALWYVLKFNVFCSLKQSYNATPIITNKSFQQIQNNN
jgi:glycosyltransferase involved in cell wall biosynthesis